MHRLLSPSRLFFKRSYRLSCYSTNKELKELFAPFGEVKEARLVIDGRTRRPKGFGFVTYESEIDAQRALKAMDGRDHFLFDSEGKANICGSCKDYNSCWKEWQLNAQVVSGSCKDCSPGK
ncbi:hypothetical protein Scep_015760 [Stephania cephalantha]|uniref:RRM domain-containing protein n=1 Tax=Stephania cephalantha TaxID=152367 RepID=A0AAP0J3Q9_9MAGN